MKLPRTLIEAAAKDVLPTCSYVHGEEAFANIKLDEMSADSRIAYLDDRMPFRFTTNKYRVITGTTFTCMVMLLIPSKLADTPDVREPRTAEMVDASARFMVALGRQPEVLAVAMGRPAEVVFNEFDLNADGVALYLDITLRGGLNLCLPPSQSQV